MTWLWLILWSNTYCCLYYFNCEHNDSWTNLYSTLHFLSVATASLPWEWTMTRVFICLVFYVSIVQLFLLFQQICHMPGNNFFKFPDMVPHSPSVPSVSFPFSGAMIWVGCSGPLSSGPLGSPRLSPGLELVLSGVHVFLSWSLPSFCWSTHLPEASSGGECGSKLCPSMQRKSSHHPQTWSVSPPPLPLLFLSHFLCFYELIPFFFTIV